MGAEVSHVTENEAKSSILLSGRKEAGSSRAETRFFGEPDEDFKESNEDFWNTLRLWMEFGYFITITYVIDQKQHLIQVNPTDEQYKVSHDLKCLPIEVQKLVGLIHCELEKNRVNKPVEGNPTEFICGLETAGTSSEKINIFPPRDPERRPATKEILSTYIFEQMKEGKDISFKLAHNGVINVIFAAADLWDDPANISGVDPLFAAIIRECISEYISKCIELKS